MKKKYIALVCACAAAFSLNTAAFAQTYTAASVSGNSVELNLSSDYGRAQYTIYLLKPGGELPADEKGISTAFDKIESIDASGDISGVFKRHVVNFEFDEGAPYGVYKAIIGGGEIDGKIIDITYANPSEEQTAVAEVNGASASTIGAVLSKYQDKVWSLDVDKAIYQSNKSEVETNVAAILGGGALSAQDVAEAFEKACMLSEIKNCDSADIYTKLFLYEEYLGVIYSTDVKNKDAALADIFVHLKKTESMTTPVELETVLRASEAVAKVNAANRDTVIDVIKEYNDILKLDLEGKFKTVDAYQMAKGIIAGKTYMTPWVIADKFNALVAELSKPKTENVIGGGGGGGGGTAVRRNDANSGPLSPIQGGVNSELVSSLDRNSRFNDLENALWAVSYIEYMAENNIMNGDGNGQFRPGDTITRAEFIKVLISALNLENAEVQNPVWFEDVPEDAWYAGYVKTGSGLGITNGVAPTAFAPLQQVSRQDAAVMIVNAVKASGLQLHPENKEITFLDNENISDYAKEAVLELVNADVISGYEDGTFLPQNALLRSETAKLVYTMLSGLKD